MWTIPAADFYFICSTLYSHYYCSTVRINALKTLKISRISNNWKLLCCKKLARIENWWLMNCVNQTFYVNISWMFYFNWVRHILNIFLFIQLSKGESSKCNTPQKHAVRCKRIAIKSLKRFHSISNNNQEIWKVR